MALETGTYISDLVETNPVGTDTLDKADDHLRLLKTTIKATFPNIAGAVTPTHTELNFVDGVTSSIQTQLDNKYPLYATNTAGITAGTNAQGQGALTTDLNVVTTTAANPSGVTLPTATAGRTVKIANRGTNPIAVFPATGAAINGLAANASIQIAVGGEMEFWATSSTQWYATNTGYITLDGSGNVGVGASPTALFKLSASDTNSIIGSFGTGGYGAFYARGSGTNPAYLFMANVTNGEQGRIGTADTGIMSFYNTASATERLRIDASGNILNVSSGGLGYGTGSGGTVTQLTSKTTGVTLNKTNGQITLAGSTITAGSTALFTLTNSAIAATDILVLAFASGGTPSSYRIEPQNVGAGAVNIRVTNISGGSLSEVFTITFAVIKAVTA